MIPKRQRAGQAEEGDHAHMPDGGSAHHAPNGGNARPVPDHRRLVGFYEDSYAREGSEAELYSRWRALGAIGKADHVVALCERARLAPASTLDVGCGDGALLCELHARRFGGSLHGVEIAQAAVDIAAARPQIESVKLYDGVHLPANEQRYQLGIVSHVLEHVPDPVALLRETARVCRAVVVEVPLEDNLSARRASKRVHADEVGHLQSFSRAHMRAIVAGSGLRVAGELDDALPLCVHVFFARGARAKIAAFAKWLARALLHRLAPPLARRLFTVHYACLCTPA